MELPELAAPYQRLGGSRGDGRAGDEDERDDEDADDGNDGVQDEQEGRVDELTFGKWEARVTGRC